MEETGEPSQILSEKPKQKNASWFYFERSKQEASRGTFVSSIRVASSDISESILEWTKLVLDIGNFFARVVGF